MRSIGRGRIVLWEGASLWAFEVLRTTEARHSTEAHSHHALQFTYSVDGDFDFRIGSEAVRGPAVLIAPDVPHIYTAQGRNAILFIEPESRLGSALLRDLSGRPYSRPDPARFADTIPDLTRVWEGPRPDDSALVTSGRTIVARLADSVGDTPIDARLLKVLDLLKSDDDLRMTASAAASIACLSESRFSHLFVEQVGLQFRTYVLWRRLSIAVERMALGATLTQAAHEAGFADSAHFSRTFLRMFGIPASVLLMI